MKKFLSYFSWYQKQTALPKLRYFLFTLAFTQSSFTYLANAQKVIWDKTIGGDQSENLASFQLTTDGGYIAGGTSYSDKSGDKTQASRGRGEADFWVVKLQVDGTIAWDKTFGGKGQEVLAFVQQTSDGGYILGGTSGSGISGDKTETNRDTSNYFAYKGDYWVVKLNANGIKEWDKTIGGIFIDQLSSIRQTHDGGYILGGTSFSGMGGDKTEPAKKLWGQDYWVVKLKADGSKEWDKTIGGLDQDRLESVQQTSDGSYLISGLSSSGIDHDKTTANKGNTDYWVVKLDAKGSKIWDKTYGGDSSEGSIFGKGVLQPTPDGGFMLGGTTSSDQSGDVSQKRRGSDDFWVLKLTADGTKVWDKTIGGRESDELTSILLTKDGGYILGGYSASGISGDKSEANKGDQNSFDYWVIKLDAEGKVITDKTIGGNHSDMLTSLILASDNSLILSGDSNSGKSGDKTQANKGDSDFWIVKAQNSFLLNQTLVFNPVLNSEVSAPPITLSAKASSGLPVSYQVIAGPATISGNKLTVTGPGNVRLKAIQSGNNQYRPAEALQSLVVTLTGKKAQMVYGSTKADSLKTMLATPDGGYLLAGTSLTYTSATSDKSQGGQGSTDYWVVKIGKNGQKQWDKTYGGSAAEQLTAVIATSDGGYLLGGSSYSGVSGDKTQASKGKADYWLVKIDATGKLLGNWVYGGSQDDKLNALLITPEGYLLGGTSASGKSGHKSASGKGLTDYWILKINSAGSVIWDKTYGGSKADTLAAIAVIPEGGYLIGGSSASGISGDKSHAARAFADYWVLRLNEQGDKIWDNTYGGVIGYGNSPKGPYELGRSILSSIVVTPDNGFLLGGSSSAFPGAERTAGKPWVTAEVSDYWLVKINGSGKKLWDKGYGTRSGFPRSRPGDIEHWDQTGNSELRTILPLPGGGYLLGGTSNGDRGREKTDDNRSDISVANYDYLSDEFGSNIPLVTWNDYWIVEINEQGKKLEDRTLGGQRNDMLADVVLTPKGNFLLGGTSFSGAGADKTSKNRGNGDYWLIEVSNSKPQSSSWDASYNGQYNNTEKLYDVIKTTDGGFLSGGTIGDGKPGYWIVKSDKQGNMLWSKSYGGLEADYLSRLIQTQDGGYLLAGTSLSGRGYSKSQYSRGGSDYWIIKIDARGNKLWDKRFGGSGSDELRKVVQLPSGEYVIAGFSNSPASGDKSQGTLGGSDYWVVKISNTGTKIWDKRYGGSLDETLGSFTPTLDGGFFLGGTSLSGKSGDKTEPSRGQKDYWVLKLNKNGNILWDKTYGGSGQDEAYSVGRGSNSNLFVAGHSTSPASTDKSQNSQGGKDYWLITLDAAGNKLWDKTFGGNQDDELRASSFTTDGGYILGGTSASGKNSDKTQASQGKTDYWAVKVDAQGNKQWDKRFGGDQDEDLHVVFQTKDGGFLLGGSSISGISGDRSQYNQAFDNGFEMRLTYDFWLIKIAPDSLTTSKASRTATLPTTLAEIADLAALIAYPNPFQERISIRFTLTETLSTTLRVLDSQGRVITTLFQEEAQANQTYQLVWQAGKQTNGMYLLQLQTPKGQTTQKILLSK